MSIKKTRTVLYALTHTVSPVFARCSNDITQYDHLSSIINDLKVLDVKMSVIAEYQKNGNIHLHGVMDMEMPQRGLALNRYKQHFKDKLLSKYFGYMDFKQIDNLEGWLKYLKKDLDETYNLLEHRRHPIIRDDFGYFNETKWNINYSLNIQTKYLLPAVAEEEGSADFEYAD